ncbi:MAG TPA: PrgI family protein [Patescibacteria group bacterium]|nr:PrgI family protein [Patescibacteria group bacterium]
MQEHPVPQNITSYEFHLIGNMTLKQFFELAAGALLAFMSYSSNLPDLFKWPLIFFFVILGIVFAFVPLQERPLDHWFLAFVRAIYNPTKFYWKKTIKVPDVFSYTTSSSSAQLSQQDTRPRKKARAEAYFRTVDTTDQKGNVDELEQRANIILTMYDTTTIKTTPSVGKKMEQEVVKPSLQVEPHVLHAISSLPPGEEAAESVEVQTQQTAELIQAVYTPPVIVPEEGVVKIEPATPVVVFSGAGQGGANQFVYQEQQQVVRPTSESVPVKTNIALPFPKTPTSPNLIVGMVLNQDGKILDGCIIEIRDHTGMPVRALRTNKLGQFFVSTPLPSGEYEIVAERDGYSFDTMKLVLAGTIVQPIEIQAKTV